MVNITNLKTIAPLLQSMSKDPHARVFYDITADALIWTDEFPLIADSDAISCLRYVLRYRTSVILGQPEVRYERYWSEVAAMCPNWPGFILERKSPLLAPTYRDLAQKGNARLEVFFEDHPE